MDRQLAVRILGDPVLRKKAQPVRKPIPRRIVQLVDQMFRTMEDERGIGLAAPQVGDLSRVIVVDTREDGERLALINPRVVSASAESGPFNEGCLSIPGINADVIRPLRVTVTGLTLAGKLVKIEADDLLARVLQHEIDHLDGVLFIDRVSEEDRRRLTDDLRELARLGKRGQVPATT